MCYDYYSKFKSLSVDLEMMIGRPYTDFKTLYAVDEQTRKMLRHQEYLDRREKRMVITYHDNMYVPPDQEDIHLLALQQAGGRVGYIASEY